MNVKDKVKMMKKLRSVNKQVHINFIKLIPVLFFSIGATSLAADKTLIDYFLPTPITDSLSKDVWGAAEVGPRDAKNGLEDTTMKKWCYWDGQIIKGPDGKCHIFASRWDQARGHNGWVDSLAVHAVSDKVTGPYIDKGLCWPGNQGGKGHNVTGLAMPDGRYAVVVSDTRPGDVFVSKSLDGPWEMLGSIKVDANGFEGAGMTNVSIMIRPDGDYMIVPRSGAILISKKGILGPYKVQGSPIFPQIPGLPRHDLEDPVVWHSGGLYHIVVNCWSERKAFHLTSPDGIKNWTNRGLAYDPTKDFVRYTDGTVNHWHKMERPGVLMENGRVTHFTFAVLDVPKDDERGNDTHGSKVIVVPFDGAALDRDLHDNTRTFKADKRYLVFPCARGRTGQNKVSVDVDGKPYMAVANTLITSSEPDHWRFIDLRLMQGKTLSVKIEGPGAAAIDLVKVSDTIPGKYPLYQEPGRPKVHFSPPRGSLNDPCGMIYYEGQWHLYYAAKRFSNADMGSPNSMWGHATSTDLLHWEEQPLFLAAVEGQYSFWTGGAAVDVENTTGLGKPGKPAIVYSANNGGWGASYTQCIFVSTDGGMTALWNPEMMYKPLPKEDARRGGGTRDPMILWWAPEKKWVMVVHNDPTGSKGGFYFFESKDLKNWTETSVLDDQCECPNLFSLPVDGNKANMRWVVLGSQNPYQIGKFDGKAFVPDDKNNTKIRAHFGQFSSSQVFANAPGGRIVQVGWAHCCWYETEFSQMAAFPLELSLRTTPEGVRMYQDFIPELAKLRKQGSTQNNVVVKADSPFKVGDVSQPAEIIVEFEPGSASQVSFTGAELDIRWDARTQELKVKEFVPWAAPTGEWTTGYWPDKKVLKASPKNGHIVLHILLDVASVEVVTNGGENYVVQGRDYRKLGEKSPMEIRAEGGDVKFSRLEIYPLKSIH